MPIKIRKPVGWVTILWSTAAPLTPRERSSSTTSAGDTSWDSPVEVPIRVFGTAMELSIPRSVAGLKVLPATIDFKWCDSIQQTGDWSDFTLNGDAAPNDRYNYRARFLTPAH